MNNDLMILLGMVNSIKEFHKQEQVESQTEEVVETVEVVKKKLGRPRKYERNTDAEPTEKSKAGRKKLQNLYPERYNEEGKYIYKYPPLPNEYFKKYYQEVIKCPCSCPICGMLLSSNQKMQRHQTSKYCLKAKQLQTPDEAYMFLKYLKNNLKLFQK